MLDSQGGHTSLDGTQLHLWETGFCQTSVHEAYTNTDILGDWPIRHTISERWLKSHHLVFPHEAGTQSPDT